MNIVLVYNPKSGSSLSEDELRQKCDAHGITIDNLIAIGDTLYDSLVPYLDTATPTIIGAIGGDGTVSAVANIVAGTNAEFAPLPGGTLNHFTKDLQISQDIDQALEQLAHSSVHPVDVAMVNDTVFINNASIGLYPSSLHIRDEIGHKYGKWGAAVVASVRALVRFKTYTVTIGDETFKTPFVFVGNNDYKLDGVGGPVREAIDQGILSIFIAKTSSRRILLKIALFAIIGRAKELDEFDIRHVSEVTVATRRHRISVSHDGEVERLHGTLRFTIKKAALRTRY